MTSPSESESGRVPDVSIVIVAHSVRDELERCLASIAHHGGRDHQVIVVDNASVDGTVEWLERSWPAVEVVPLAENRFGAARNEALGKVRGRYTMFLDSDAELTEGAVTVITEALDRDPSIGLLGPRLVYPSGELQYSCRRYPPAVIPLLRRPPLAAWFEGSDTVRHHLMEDVDHSRAQAVLYVIGACQMFRSSLIDTLGGIDPRLGWGGEDIDWCIRVWDAGFSVRYEPAAAVIHAYRRQSNASPFSLAALRHLRSFVTLQFKYRHRYRALLEFDPREAT